jgi:hypothetical protein
MTLTIYLADGAVVLNMTSPPLTPERSFMRRILAAATLFVLSAGCYADTFSYPGTPATGGTDTGVAGTYTLQTVNGSPVPYTYYQSGADSYVVLSDTVVIAAGGAWTESWHERRTVGGTVTTPAFTDRGTYAVNGSDIVFTFQAGGTSSGSFNSGTLSWPVHFSNGTVAPAIYTK